MLKSELIETINKKAPKLSRQDCDTLVEVVLDRLQQSLTCGDRVELRGFGSFHVKRLGSKKGRNPKTGEPIFIPPKLTPRFRASKVLLEKMNCKNA